MVAIDFKKPGVLLAGRALRDESLAGFAKQAEAALPAFLKSKDAGPRIEALVGCFGPDTNGNVRLGAIHLLAELGKGEHAEKVLARIKSELATDLNSLSGRVVKNGLVATLGRIGSAAASEVLLQVLDDAKNEKVPAHASPLLALSLAGQGAKGALPKILETLQQDSSSHTALAARKVFSKSAFAEELEAQKTRLVIQLSSSDFEVAKNAAKLLVQMGPRVIGNVIKVAASDSHRAKHLAAQILLNLTKEPHLVDAEIIRQKVLEALTSTNVTAICGACAIIDRFGKALFGSRLESKIAPLLINRLGSSHHTIGLAASDSLARIGSATIPALTEALKSPKPNAKYFAARALATFGTAAASAAPVVAEQLAAIDLSATESVPAKAAGDLTKIASNRDLLKRLGDTLAKVGAQLPQPAENLVSDLRKTFVDAPLSFARRCLRFLGARSVVAAGLELIEKKPVVAGADPASEQQSGKLISGLRSFMQAGLRRAQEFLRTPEVTRQIAPGIELIRHRLENGSGREAVNMITALPRFSRETKGVVATVVAALGHAETGVRVAAALQLKRLGDRAVIALPKLYQVLANGSEDTHVRIAAIKAVRGIPGDIEPRVAALAQALSAGNSTVRIAALSALEHFGADAEPAFELLKKLYLKTAPKTEGGKPVSPRVNAAVVRAMKAIDPKGAILFLPDSEYVLAPVA